MLYNMMWVAPCSISKTEEFYRTVVTVFVVIVLCRRTLRSFPVPSLLPVSDVPTKCWTGKHFPLQLLSIISIWDIRKQLSESLKFFFWRHETLLCYVRIFTEWNIISLISTNLERERHLGSFILKLLAVNWRTLRSAEDLACWCPTGCAFLRGIYVQEFTGLMIGL